MNQLTGNILIWKFMLERYAKVRLMIKTYNFLKTYTIDVDVFGYPLDRRENPEGTIHNQLVRIVSNFR